MNEISKILASSVKKTAGYLALLMAASYYTVLSQASVLSMMLNSTFTFGLALALLSNYMGDRHNGIQGISSRHVTKNQAERMNGEL
jgi:hypothetical protein